MSVWSAPVRYAEVDGQGVVFNSHYLVYCDEAMSSYCRQRGLTDMSDRVQLISSTLTWKSSARWGDTVEVDVECTRLGRTSFTLGFDVRVGDRLCCQVATTYVLTDGAGRPEPLPESARAALSG